MSENLKKLPAVFYRSASGNEPVRDWLKRDVSDDDRKIIGHDICDCELSWPIGMPLCKSLSSGLWEVRSNISGKSIARVIFCVHDSKMILLHAFKKKTQKTPKKDLDIAIKRMKDVKNG